MSSHDKKVSPNEFFQAIGDKVEPAANSNDDEQQLVEEIESLCMNCQKNGTTRMLLTSIPYFREIIIMSFHCEHCHTRNNEIQAAGQIQAKGTRYELRLTDMADFARQVVKSDTAIVKFIEMDLEIPAGKGQLTNVEGLLTTVMDDLEFGQEARKEQMPEVHVKVAEIIAKGRSMLNGDGFPFRMSVDDPAGNSFITPDFKDGIGKWEKREYLRTAEQNEALGLSAQNNAAAVAADAEGPGLDAEGNVIPNEVYSFPASCPGCMKPCVTHMKMVDIPHFKQVIIMSTVCDECGYRSNDVKTGGEIPEKGEKITIAVDNGAVDMARDILKSETCAMECPELGLSVQPGTLGGRFTTIEGLLTQVRDDLHSQIFESGDSATANDSLAPEQRTKWNEFFDGLNVAIAGEKKFTVILTDPFASSYVQSLVDPPAQDPQIVKEAYERTEEEEEDLGLKDMKTEGYEQAHQAAAANGDEQQQRSGEAMDNLIDASRTS